jgi:hypothetical protein
MRLGQHVALVFSPAAQAGELAVDGLLAFLTLGGHASIDRGAHRIISPQERVGGSADVSVASLPAASRRGVVSRRR